MCFLQGGLVEYWSGDGEPPSNVAFKSKLDTDLFEFAKNKTRPFNLSVSPGGKFLAAFSADKKVRLFTFNVINPNLKLIKGQDIIYFNLLSDK